ncbi:MAG: methyltransferase domain-containing protein [Rhodospirillales bacterium]
MLERARLTGLYDELVEDELTAFLGARDRAFDLIISADTFCYFGALPPLFRAAAQALRPGGRLVFTLERAEEEVTDRTFVLNIHGRYAHTEAVVRSALGNAGFGEVSIATGILRKERLDDVAGLIVWARRAESNRSRLEHKSAWRD